MRPRPAGVRIVLSLSLLSLLILGLFPIPWSSVPYHVAMAADNADGDRSGDQNDNNQNSGSGDANQNQDDYNTNDDNNQANQANNNRNKNYKNNNSNGNGNGSNSNSNSASTSTARSTAYAMYNTEGDKFTFDAVSIMPVSCINYNKGNLIKFQLFERTTSYKCHFRELGTYVVSIAHFMRSYFNYQALVKGNNFDLPKDASYLNCVMLEETLNGQKLYAKIGCESDSDSSVTSTNFALHLYTNKKCTQLLDSADGSTSYKYKSKSNRKFGYYMLNGKVFSTDVSFRPPFFTCMHCQPDEIANSFTKSRNWYDDDYINVEGGNKVYVYEDDANENQGSNLDDYYYKYYNNATDSASTTYYNATSEDNDNTDDDAVQGGDDDASAATNDYYNYNAYYYSGDASAEDGEDHDDDAAQNDVSDNGAGASGNNDDQAAESNDDVYYNYNQRTDDNTAATSSSNDDDDATTTSTYYSSTNTNDDTSTTTGTTSTTVTDDFAAQYFSKADDDTNQNYNFNDQGTYYTDDNNIYYYTDDYTDDYTGTDDYIDDNVDDGGSNGNGGSSTYYDTYYADNDDTQAASASSGNSSTPYYATATDDGGYFANAQSEENDDADADEDAANDDQNNGDDDTQSGYYRRLSTSTSNQATTKVFSFVPAKGEVEKFTTTFWNDVTATRQRALEGSSSSSSSNSASSSSSSNNNNNRNNIDAVGHYWNFCQRLHYYGLECGSDCQALNSFRYNHWTSSEITLLVGMCAFMVVMILCIFVRQVRASQKAYIYGDEFDLPAEPQLTPLTLMIAFGVLLAALTGMAKLKLVGETLVLALAACMLLFIYVLKQALFENMGGHNSLFAPRRKNSGADDPNNMGMDRHFDSMNRQLFDA